MGCRQTSSLLALKWMRGSSLQSVWGSNSISYSLSRKLRTLLMRALCFSSDFFRTSSSRSRSRPFDFSLSQAIDRLARVFASTPFLKMPEILTPVLGQNSCPQPFFSPWSKRPSQTQSGVVRRPSPWQRPFSRQPMYFSVGFSTKNLPVLRPSANSPLNLICSWQASSTPRPCLRPLKNWPQQTRLSQKQRKPSQGSSRAIVNPQYTQFLNFLMEGEGTTTSQLRHKFVKKEKISDGSDFSTSFSFLQYSITRFSLISRMRLEGIGSDWTGASFLSCWRTIWPAFWLFLEGCMRKEDSMGVVKLSCSTSHWIDTLFRGDSKEKLISLLLHSSNCTPASRFASTNGCGSGLASKAALCFLSWSLPPTSVRGTNRRPCSSFSRLSKRLLVGAGFSGGGGGGRSDSQSLFGGFSGWGGGTLGCWRALVWLFLRELMSSLNCWAEEVILAMRGGSSEGRLVIVIKIINSQVHLLFLAVLVIMFLNQLAAAALLLLALLPLADAAQCPADAEEFLVTFHPHLDAFWLDSDDDLKNINFRPAGFLYAMNQRNSKTIFNSMLDALSRDATRKYFVSEVVFFKDWYDYLAADKQKQVKKLFEKGQLDLANGGWVENDEAVCYIDDIIDQYTVGHNFLNSQFGLTTKIGWATDSFGHSHSQVAIEHLLGFEFQGIERIDDRYIYERNGGSLLEFYWSAVSDSNGRKYGGVMTLVRHFLHEVNDLRHASIDGIVADFKKLEGNMRKLYQKNKLFRFLGNDFEEFVDEEFSNLESAFSKLNNGNTQCPTYKYGNPSDYLDVIKQYYQGESTPLREHDFMPNFDQDHYWSGYYTSNPDLKKICKDYSRVVNLFRKIYAKHISAGGAENGNTRTLLREADELLAVMQHHDGITATSKYHIEETFKERMRAKTTALISAISDLKQISHQSCNFYQGANSCTLNAQEDTVYLSIFHEGAPKKERVEIALPTSTAYDIFDDNDDEIFCNPKSGLCSIVFEPKLLSGENVFVLNKIAASKVLNSVKTQGGSYKDNDFSLSVSGAQFTYTFSNDDFIKVSYVQSANRLGSTSTHTWDKYGNRIDKNENRMAGIYIMANNGQLSDMRFILDNVSVAKGKVFTKIYLSSTGNSAIVTIKNAEKNVIDLQTAFKPDTRDLVDYFIKVESKINSQGEFYHDSNGYLVIKRKVGERPDYKWDYKPEDKINANNYPMCSFAYAIEGDKKLVIFTDRAQGFAQYDNSYLINIDRLTGDDYKGVGEGYNYIVDNVFHHKIGIVDKSSDIEREWQRSFDEALVGFYSGSKRQSNSKGLLSDNSKYLKYSIFLLNNDEYVLRFFNLAEQQNIELPIHTESSWTIDELDLDLKFTDIRESFANGLPLSERRSWNKVEGETNMFNAGSKDSPSKIVLSPLQVRSFRINLKGQVAGAPQEHKNSMLELTLTDVTPVAKTFAKRCF